MYSRGGGNPWERSSSAYGQHYGRPASSNSGLHQLSREYGMRPGQTPNMLASALPHSRAPATPSIFSRNVNARSELAATQGDAIMRQKVMRQVTPGGCGRRPTPSGRCPDAPMGRTAPMTAPSLDKLGGLGGLSLGGSQAGGSQAGAGRFATSGFGGRGAPPNGRAPQPPMQPPLAAEQHRASGTPQSDVGRLSIPPSRLAHPLAPGPPGSAGGASLAATAAPSLSSRSAYPQPPPTPGPPTSMSSASRTIMGTYPGKAANQDAWVVQNIAAFGDRPDTARSQVGRAAATGYSNADLQAGAGDDAIIGVYDGHGQHGHLVSAFVKDRLAAEMRQIDREVLRDPGTAEAALAAAHHRTQEALKTSGIDVSLSGSTACTALKRGRQLLIANVGDSRAVLGTLEPGGTKWVARDLSNDHKPDEIAVRPQFQRACPLRTQPTALRTQPAAPCTQPLTLTRSDSALRATAAW
jgi:serine/threonine protein phosphatase PrpC